jgi:hypothetical protein
MQRLYLILAFIGACSLIALVTGIVSKDRFALIMGSALLGYTALITVSRLTYRSSLDSRVFKLAQLLSSGSNEAHLRINDVGISYRSEISTSEFIWGVCLSYTLRGDQLLINMNHKSYGPFVIERQLLSESEFAEVLEAVRKHLPPKR